MSVKNFIDLMICSFTSIKAGKWWSRKLVVGSLILGSILAMGLFRILRFGSTPELEPSTALVEAKIPILYDSGWTVLKPSKDSRLIYVDSANGNDAAASAIHERGYYLPSDPEIGTNPSLPISKIVPYATLAEASKRVRLSKAKRGDKKGIPSYDKGNAIIGYPDWLLLKRNMSYKQNTANTDQSTNLGALICCSNQIDSVKGPWRGRSQSEPAVVTAWGPESEPRPILDGFTVGGGNGNIVITSLDLDRTEFGWGWSIDDKDLMIPGGPIIIEDCAARSFGPNNLSTFPNGIVFRRCVISDKYNPKNHNQGMFVSDSYYHGRYAIAPNQGHVISFEECVFDRNGYKEDPNQPRHWTGALRSELKIGAMTPGTGVQPTRTYYDRNLYLSTYHSVTLRGCVLSRDGGGGSVQMRQGGVSERNLFIWNESCGYIASGMGGIFKDNVILHDDHMLPPGGWGQGIGFWNNSSSHPNPIYICDGNILTHFHRKKSSEPSYYLREAQDAKGTPLQGTVHIRNNILYRSDNGTGILLSKDSMPMVTVGRNEVAIASGKLIGGFISASSSVGSSAYRIGTQDVGGNKYWSNSLTPFGESMTFEKWRNLRSDLDSASTYTNNFNKFKVLTGWINPERDIVSYMQWIDPQYTVNEDVYVDDDCSGPKQKTRQKVWEVLMRKVPGGNMTMTQAKLTARRYHAFITFIQRARANRKGAWDPRYTAGAVVNYIRDGFGRPLITEPYSATLSDTIRY